MTDDELLAADPTALRETVLGLRDDLAVRTKQVLAAADRIADYERELAEVRKEMVAALQGASDELFKLRADNEALRERLGDAEQLLRDDMNISDDAELATWIGRRAAFLASAPSPAATEPRTPSEVVGWLSATGHQDLSKAATEPRGEACKCAVCAGLISGPGIACPRAIPEPAPASAQRPLAPGEEVPASAPDCLRTMTPEEQAAFRPLTNEQIVEALARGQRDREAAERAAHGRPIDRRCIRHGFNRCACDADAPVPASAQGTGEPTVDDRLRELETFAQAMKSFSDSAVFTAEALDKRVSALETNGCKPICVWDPYTTGRLNVLCKNCRWPKDSGPFRHVDVDPREPPAEPPQPAPVEGLCDSCRHAEHRQGFCMNGYSTFHPDDHCPCVGGQPRSAAVHEEGGK